MRGENLNNANSTLDNISNQAIVTFTLDRVGAKRFGRVTSDNIGKRLAIILDNKIISAPSIREPITGGKGIITGQFSFQEATDLSMLLRAGALPAPLTIVEERTVEHEEEDEVNVPGYISVMTIHQAKGLEFDYIFLPGWEEGVFPNQRAIDEGGIESLEEERRLAYVGITRAKKEAFISFVMKRAYHGDWMDALPSRFVNELPEEGIEKNEDPVKEISDDFDFNQDNLLENNDADNFNMNIGRQAVSLVNPLTVSKSATDALKKGWLRKSDTISMNSEHLLALGKKKVLELSDN